jgi:RNA polymerase sigma-70 factor, ECF subfamily
MVESRSTSTREIPGEIHLREKFQENWLELENRKILPVIFWRLGTPSQDIQDLVNETAFQACRSIMSIRDWDDFDKWIAGIARNVYRRYCRDKAARARKKEISEINFQIVGQINLEDCLCNKTVLDDCLRKLDEIERMIVPYRAVSGYKFEEISELVGKPRSSVARYYQRAIEKLRQCVAGML